MASLSDYRCEQSAVWYKITDVKSPRFLLDLVALVRLLSFSVPAVFI